jgi:DNA-binding MarR family transcriptional regulator
MEMNEFKAKLLQSTRKLNEAMDGCLDRMGSCEDLTPNQARIIMIMNLEGSASMGKISDSASIAGGNLTNICKVLEKRGLVERGRDPSDDRKVLMQLTPKGVETASKLDAWLTRKMEKGMPENREDLMLMVEGLEKLSAMIIEMTEEKTDERD